MTEAYNLYLKNPKKDLHISKILSNCLCGCIACFGLFSYTANKLVTQS